MKLKCRNVSNCLPFTVPSEACQTIAQNESNCWSTMVKDRLCNCEPETLAVKCTHVGCHTWCARSWASASDAHNQFSKVRTCQQVNPSAMPYTMATLSFCNSPTLRVCVWFKGHYWFLAVTVKFDVSRNKPRKHFTELISCCTIPM